MDCIATVFISGFSIFHGCTSLTFLITQGLSPIKNDIKSNILPIKNCLNSFVFPILAIKKHPPPMIASIHAMVWSRLLSAGIQTFMIDQRLSPVNIARNTKKNPMYHQNDRSLYANNPKIARINMRVVTFTLKANPRRIPTRISNLYPSFQLFRSDSFVYVKNNMKTEILKNRSAGSSFMSLV